MPRLRQIDDFGFGLSWELDEPMARTSHALRDDDGRVWFIDPVDLSEPMERAAALGEPAGVLQLLDRHNRDCAAVAQRLGVPHHNLPATVPDAPFEVVRVIQGPGWKELALWWPERRVLVVSETVGTGPFFRGDEAPVGVHPFLRLKPPKALRTYEPEHLLVGHGANVHGPQAAAGLHEAYRRTRRDLPRTLLRIPKALRG